MPDTIVEFFAVFSLHPEKNYSSDTKFFPQPLISTNKSRCPANFINLSAIIEDLRLSEYDCKLRHDIQIAICGVTPDGRCLKNSTKKRILRTLLPKFAQHVLIH